MDFSANVYNQNRSELNNFYTSFMTVGLCCCERTILFKFALNPLFFC